MYEDAEPISYQGVALGTPLLSSSGTEFGTLAKVLQIPSEDLFDGVIVDTQAGRRFVDRDQIAEITTRYIKCDLDDDAVTNLPPPSGSPVYRADPLQDEGKSIGDWIGKTFRHGKWKQES
jgi:hypothetical protein